MLLSERADSVPQVDLRGRNSLFGTLGGKAIPTPVSTDFIPLDDQGNIIDFTTSNGNPAWLGLEYKSMQWWAYNYCSPLASVIDRLASAYANGLFKFRNEDNTIVANPNKNPRLARIRKLLRKPNPWQTSQEFESEKKVLCSIFGWTLVWFIKPAGMDKSYSKMMVNLNPYYCTPEYDYTFNLSSGDGNVVKRWMVNVHGRTFTIDSEDVMLVKDGFVNTTSSLPYLPISKISGLDYAISNICAAMEADNVLLKKRGPLGFISYDSKPEFGSLLPANPADIDELQEDLKRYGLTWGQLQHVISKMPARWNPMSYNSEELKIKETIRQGIDMVCDRFDYPAELMSGKNATYENRTSAERFMYQNNIIPYSIRDMARYDDCFELDSISLTKDFNHLPVLQEDILHAGQAREARSKSLLIDWQAGLISFNEYRFLSELDEIPGKDDYYYIDYLKENNKILGNGQKKTSSGESKKSPDEGKAD